jgi:hypothetical protein
MGFPFCVGFQEQQQVSILKNKNRSTRFLWVLRLLLGVEN